MSKDFDYIQHVLNSASSISNGMTQLLDYCDVNLPNPLWGKIRNLEFESDTTNLRFWLENVLSNEPPSQEINGFWFGLYNPVLDNGEVSCRLYISGSTKFSREDETGDWAAWDNSSYLPEGRYADSKVLHELFRLIENVRERFHLHNRNADFFVEEIYGLEDGKYLLCLGYACLAVKAICGSINPKLLFGERDTRAVVVGFDSGDWIILN